MTDHPGFLLLNESNSITKTHSTTLSTNEDNHLDYIRAATSDNTRKAYQSDIRHFLNWGGRLPTTYDSILSYLTAHAKKLNSRTLSRRLTAIKNWHRYQGFSDPTSHPLIQKTISGIKNIHGKPKDKALPMTLETISLISQHLYESNRLQDCRNQALLLIGFFGAFRRSELVAIRWEEITFVPEGLEILIPRSKTDQTGEGQVCAIPKSENPFLCPVAALTAWSKRGQYNTGPVFRTINKSGLLLETRISPQLVNTIIKSVAQSAQLPNALDYSSHSLRRGFATEASKYGAPFGSIMRQGRWHHEGTVLGYIDEGKRFDLNAAGFVINKAI